MNESKSAPIRRESASDAVIDGLFAGLVAGILMIVVIILGGLISGESPASVLGRFSTGQAASPAAGGLLHLAVSGIYGGLYGLLEYWMPSGLRSRLPGWLMGMVYSLLLLVLAFTVLLPGLGSPLVELPLWVLALGHSVYGLVLGLRT